MIRKSDLSLRLGMTMLVLCAALILTALPAAADYSADKNLTEKYSGIITGEMNYTVGDSYYSPKMWSNDDYVYTTTILEAIPNNAETVKARLYVYFTWSFSDTNATSSKYDTGVPDPSMNVTFNGQPLTLLNNEKYNDSKGYDGYNYHSGTYCYDVTGNVTPGGVKSYVVNITNSYDGEYNQSFNIQGVGLLTLYNNTCSQKQYWIDDGCDMTLVNSTILPSLATARANFSGLDNSSISSGELITVVPAGSTEYNTLYFNGNYIDEGLWDGNPRDGNLSYATTTLDANAFIYGLNWAGIRNGLDANQASPNDGQMQAANAFLLVR